MKKQIPLTVVFVVFVAAFLIPADLLGASYYEGKVLTIISGHAPGGGYDRMARLLAKYLPKYIPGKPSVIVQNMPGAGSIIAANHLFNLAKPDGLTIGSLERTITLTQLMGEKALKLDVRKFSWIGSAASEPTVLVIRNDLPYKSIQDLLKSKETIHFGDMGLLGDHMRVIPLLLRDYAGLKVNLISYPGGSRDALLALERKEIDAMYVNYSSNKPYIVRGLLRPVLRGKLSVPEIEQLPLSEEIVNGKNAKAIIALYSATDIVGRPYMAPPGTPDDMMKILREAFAKVPEDPELKIEAEKVMMPVGYLSAEESLKIVTNVLNQPEDIVVELIKYSKL